MFEGSILCFLNLSWTNHQSIRNRSKANLDKYTWAKSSTHRRLAIKWVFLTQWNLLLSSFLNHEQSDLFSLSAIAGSINTSYANACQMNSTGFNCKGNNISSPQQKAKGDLRNSMQLVILLILCMAASKLRGCVLWISSSSSYYSRLDSFLVDSITVPSAVAYRPMSQVRSRRATPRRCQRIGQDPTSVLSGHGMMDDTDMGHLDGCFEEKQGQDGARVIFPGTN